MSRKELKVKKDNTVKFFDRVWYTVVTVALLIGGAAAIKNHVIRELFNSVYILQTLGVILVVEGMFRLFRGKEQTN